MVGDNGLTDLQRLEFRDFSTDGTYLMAMAVIIIAGLILCRSLKTVSNDQPQLHEELQRVIQRSPAHGETQLFIQFFAQLLQREMPIDAIYGIKNGHALRRLSQAILFQVPRQDVPDRFLDIFFHFMGSYWI